MLKFVVRLAAVTAASGAVLALAGCGGASPSDAPPPPQAYSAPSVSAQPLAGGPAPSKSRLAGGPRKPTTVIHMAPIPNPEDLPPAERHRIYGTKYDGHHATGPAHRPLKTWKRADGTTVVAMRPIANPEDMSARERARVYGNRYAPRAHSAAAPRRHAAIVSAPAPVARPAAKPAAVMTAKPVAPVVVAAKPAAAVVAAVTPVITPAKPAMDPKLAKLQAVVGPAAANGAVLTVADSVTKGSPGKVSLSLAPELLDVIKREAAKLGLTKAAKKTDVSATLTGDGYEITPNGAQTAHLKTGEPAVFDWLVKPGAGDKGPLKASVDASLKGSGKAQTFSLASIEQAIRAAIPIEAPKAKRGAFELPDVLAIPGMKEVDLPLVGKVPSKNVVTALIALLILLILIMAMRGGSASKAREERRRKFRALADHDAAPEPASHQPVSYSPPLVFADEPTPAPHQHPNYVNPMIAAAAGAAAGAAVMHAHDEHKAQAVSHDDHGHHEEPHAPAEHPAEAHVEDAHVEDAHAAPLTVHGADPEPAHAEHREPEHA